VGQSLRAEAHTSDDGSTDATQPKGTVLPPGVPKGTAYMSQSCLKHESKQIK